MLTLQSDDEHFGHALSHSAFVLVQTAELGLRLGAARIEAPGLGEKVVGSKDCRLQGTTNRLI